MDGKKKYGQLMNIHDVFIQIGALAGHFSHSESVVEPDEGSNSCGLFSLRN